MLCPKCHSTSTIKIVYGEPSELGEVKAKRGEIFLGGCEVSRESPSTHCKNCGHNFGSFPRP